MGIGIGMDTSGGSTDAPRLPLAFYAAPGSHDHEWVARVRRRPGGNRMLQDDSPYGEIVADNAVFCAAPGCKARP